MNSVPQIDAEKVIKIPEIEWLRSYDQMWRDEGFENAAEGLSAYKTLLKNTESNQPPMVRPTTPETFVPLASWFMKRIEFLIKQASSLGMELSFVSPRVVEKINTPARTTLVCVHGPKEMDNPAVIHTVKTVLNER